MYDEARVSNIARSPDWIAAEYSNQNSPSSFYTVGSQQTGGGGGNVSITVTASIAGVSLTVDGSNCTAPCSFTWASGSNHTIGVTWSAQWGQSYGYDGFGNLTDQTLIKGTGPDVHVSVNPANNRLYSDSYDANGNDVTVGTAYNVENRLVSAAGVLYGYAPNGKRVWKAPDGNQADEEFYFWAPNGQRLGTYKSTSPGNNGFTTASTNAYFRGRLIQAQGTPMLADRLGSNVSGGKRYFPFGQERPSATTNNIEKFTGYYRDAETGLDYADQRFYASTYGRFSSPDPARSAKPKRPLSWNRYSYVGGDPINRSDPMGLDWVYAGGGQWCSTVSGDCQNTDCTENPAACADSLGENDGGAGGSESSASSSAPADNTPPQPTPSVFACDLGSCDSSNFTSFSGAYDLNNGAPGFGWINVDVNNINSAYQLACYYAANGCSTNQVTVQNVGGTLNLNLLGNPISLLPGSVDSCWADPISGLFHQGANGSYYCGSNLFGNTGHVVDNVDSTGAHFDDPGPWNPLHWLTSMFAPFKDPVQFYTCNIDTGCSLNPGNP